MFTVVYYEPAARVRGRKEQSSLRSRENSFARLSVYVRIRTGAATSGIVRSAANCIRLAITDAVQYRFLQITIPVDL